MKYLFDSNVVSALFDETNVNHKKAYDRLLKLKESDELYISVLSIFEFKYSFFGCKDQEKRKSIFFTINKINSFFKKLDLTEEQSDNFGKIKSLIKYHKNISSENMKKLNIDIMIASASITNNCTVVSGDKIFKTISELDSQFQYENWLE